MHLHSCEPDEIRADLPAPDPTFEALFRDHFGFVYQNLRRLGVPPGAVEDAAQEVFLVVLRRADAPITSTRGWLFGIARRIAWRYRRSAQRHDRLTRALAEEDRPALDGAGAVAEREAAALLERFLGRLDDDKRAVFLLAELEQMTAPEIARALGVKENTVYSRLRAARQEFDRSFARVRLRERRATGEATLDETALLLSRARRAHQPSQVAHQRVLLLLLAPAVAGLGGPGAAWAASGVEAGQASPWAAGPGAQLSAGKLPAWSGGALFRLGAAGGGATTWGAVLGVVGALVLVVRTAGPGEAAAERHAPVEVVARHADVGAAGAATDAPSVPFSRLSAAAQRAAQRAEQRPSSGPAPGREGPRPNVPKNMSDEPDTTAPAEPPRAAAGGSVAARPIDLDALRREAALMAEAQAALHTGAWTRARELLQRHALEFPSGALVDERRLSSITVLCSTAQVAAARAEAARIEAEQPGSTLARKANAICPDRATRGPAAPGD